MAVWLSFNKASVWMTALAVVISSCIIGNGEATASDLSEMFAKNESSVVTIRAGSKIGTGFYVTPDFLVTNFHVIKGSSSVVFYNNYADGGTPVQFAVVLDPANDLAILRAPRQGKPVQLAGNAGVSPGAELFAIGSPRGYEKTITNGVLSQKRKDGILQISIAVSPGSSGSPVFDMQGEVVGVVVAQRTDSQNLNFAIPSDRVSQLLQKAEGVSQANYIEINRTAFSQTPETSGGPAGTMDVDLTGIDVTLSECRKYSSTVYENSTASLIKLCVCNDAVMLTNRLCQCPQCRR